MTDTMELAFSNTIGPSNGSLTSWLAAVCNGKRTGGQRFRLLVGYMRFGVTGMTDEETQDRLGMGGNTQRPRRGELAILGLVRKTGETRRTRGGDLAEVWQITSKGLAILDEATEAGAVLPWASDAIFCGYVSL